MGPTVLRALAPLALMGVIFYLSSQESVGPELPAFTRIVAHFAEYGVLAALWFWALAPALGARRAVWAAAAICAVYALSDEYHQRFVEGRDSDLLDVVTDWAGIAAALWLVTRARPARSRRTARRAPEPPA
jgi:VanZ family protein